MKLFLLAGSLAFFTSLKIMAAPVPLTESTFTEIIKEANVLGGAGNAVVPAKTNMVFHSPDRVRTGSASRVELTAPDQTITRVGANTVFTFANQGRTIELEKGGVLFHAPAGVGGGTVQHHGAAAAVLGTTMICSVMPDGRFKVLDLEGKVRVTLKNGLAVELKAGQMVVVTTDDENFEGVEFFNLKELVARLSLVIGFSRPLASMPLIELAILEQRRQIVSGEIKSLISANVSDFGLDIVHRSNGLGQILPPETPDHTQVPTSQVQKNP